MKHPVIVNIDVEPDPFFVDPAQPDRWRGFESAVVFFNEWRKKMQAATGEPVKFSWFFRLDPQIEETYGDVEWPLHIYQREISELQDAGDELGIHVHAYKRADNKHHWVEDYGNQQWVNRCIELSHTTFRNHFGADPRIFSMGGDWINNDTIRYAEKLGIRVDLTLVAGSKKNEEYLREFAGDREYTGKSPDLSRVKPSPYRPAEDDYRHADDNRNGGIWIFPLTHVSDSFEVEGPSIRRLLYSREHKAKLELVKNLHTKVFADCPRRELTTQLKRLEKSSDNEYLTLVMATRKFTGRKAAKRIVENFGILGSRRHRNKIELTTACEVLDID